ncbi:unnamed protein product [Coffea canephora]|uniref:Helicase ATP-binding domain-containing protein n=1 Tax=Coffea canephora TaxID=49390 RepID=A0A068UE97_COFCA|nr:unnamed protein product [Coffea canephora]
MLCLLGTLLGFAIADIPLIQKNMVVHSQIINDVSTNKDGTSKSSDIPVGFATRMKDHTNGAKAFHPCWSIVYVMNMRAPTIYVNIFSWEAATQFPIATQTARGGANAMGLGKTVMTIALILARQGRGTLRIKNQLPKVRVIQSTSRKRKRNLISNLLEKITKFSEFVCILNRHKDILSSSLNKNLLNEQDELETHSKPDSISVSVFFGGDRGSDPRVIAEHDVILTTYDVLTAACKNDGENSIFHRVDWYRVVLDEAHTIESSKTLGAQAAYKLSSYCRRCLTGTPLQNKLEDLYNLLCFLHVEPWCGQIFFLWQKLIQKPYESGDYRGIKLIKAIWRPLKLYYLQTEVIIISFYVITVSFYFFNSL